MGRTWDDVSGILYTGAPAAQPLGAFDMPNFSEILAALDDPILPHLRCPIVRRTWSLQGQVQMPVLTQVTGGSVLDAVLFVVFHVFVAQDCGEVSEHFGEKLSRGKKSQLSSEAWPRMLEIVRSLVSRHVPSLVLKDAQCFLSEGRLPVAGLQLAVAAGFGGSLIRLNTAEHALFLHEKVVFDAMIDGWPSSVIQCLRKHGAVTRLAIAKAVKTLRSMIAGNFSPLLAKEDVDFFKRHPHIQYFPLPVDDTVPYSSIEHRLANALAWHKSETLAAKRLQQTLARFNFSVAGGRTIKLCGPALFCIDAFLFGQQVDCS